MLMFIEKSKEELIKKIKDGYYQEEILEYIEELYNERVEHPDWHLNEPLNENTVFDFFDAEIKDTYISSDDLKIPTNDISLLLHNVIENTYQRFLNELEMNITSSL